MLCPTQTNGLFRKNTKVRKYYLLCIVCSLKMFAHQNYMYSTGIHLNGWTSYTGHDTILRYLFQINRDITDLDEQKLPTCIRWGHLCSHVKRLYLSHGPENELSPVSRWPQKSEWKVQTNSIFEWPLMQRSVYKREWGDTSYVRPHWVPKPPVNSHGYP